MNSKIGLSNILMINDSGEYKPLGSTCEATLEYEETNNDFYDFVKDINKPISVSSTIRAKRKGTIFETSLYYKHHKKKRIRKKYDLFRLLGE